ncbi:hypothetical protein HDZ31DRAFT_42667 [Schizophyllum fasciatum]
MEASTAQKDVLGKPIVIIGSGAAGLITAHTLMQDGFKNVQIVSRDAGPGGVWAEDRVYDGLFLNNVNGEFCFSPLQGAPADPRSPNLSGFDMCAYMTRFAEHFLTGRIAHNTEVRHIRRGADGTGWELDVYDKALKDDRVIRCARLVLCTGGCHVPSIPAKLTVSRARTVGFPGRMFHTSEFRQQVDRAGSGGVSAWGRIVVIGGGKSSQDICAYLARRNIPISMVFERAPAFISTSKPLPAFIRKSRLLAALSPHIHLRTTLERFLHKTWLGSKITHFIWSSIARTSFAVQRYPPHSPMRNAPSLFWTIQTNDDGAPRDGHFHTLVNEGKIALVAPNRVVGYDASGVVLADGGRLAADTVILGTGYTSSWQGLFDDDTAASLGISRHAPHLGVNFDQEWADYRTLDDPPRPRATSTQPVESSIYRGLVPVNNLSQRDFAINGAVYTTNPGYSFEVFSHWISSYFIGDPLRLPRTTSEAKLETARQSAWLRKRYPDIQHINESYSGNVAFWAWPHIIDDLLEDMGLPIFRSGGNWLTWPFKVINVRELATLKEERRAIREARRAKELQ